MGSNHRELIMRTFKRKQIEKIVWQPRLMLWYNGNHVGMKDASKARESPLKINFKKREKNVPEEWIGKNIIDIHKDLDASIRYTAETMGINYFYNQRKKDAEISRKSIVNEDGSHTTKTITPVGSVVERSAHGYKMEKPVKKVEDLEVIKYLVQNQEFHYNDFMYEAAVEELGKMGVPQCYYFRSPYQSCVLNYLGFERTTIWLRRKPKIMDEFMNFLAEWDKKAYEVIVNSDVPILNFGENIDDNLSPPRQFQKYLLPYYRERVKMLHDAGKFCHIHIDGHFHDILPLLSDLPFDGIEALTPVPQGDVTLEEMRDHIGDKILLDGIPATLFMHQFPENRLIESVEKILEYFSPNLILGISDELPGNTDARRLKTVSKMVEKFEP